MSCDWPKQQNGASPKNVFECHQTLLNVVGGVWARDKLLARLQLQNMS